MIRDAIDAIKEVRRNYEHIMDVLRETLASERITKAPKHDEWLPVSRISTLCPRALVIADRLDLDLVDEWDAQARWRADRGTALHHVFQNLWLGPSKMLLGGWKCPKCAFVHGANENGEVWPATVVVCPDMCEKCGQKWRRQDPFTYVEPHSVDEQLRVRGRIDGLLRLPGYYPEVIDL